MLYHAENQPNPLRDHFKIRSAGGRVFKKINAYRSEGTHADEWLVLFKVLLAMSSVITLGFGAALHYNLTLPYLGHFGAVAFAALFTVFLEIAKTITGIWFFRNLFFGIFKQGIPSLLIMLCGGAIFAGAFAWSIYNSTHGVGYLVKYLAPDVIERQVIDPNQKTAEVDARIDATGNLANRGLASKWKGKTTVEGLRIARNASKIQAEQERQRTILLEQAAKEQERTDQHRDAFVDRVSMLFSMLGGKAEWFQLLFIAGWVLCECSLWQRIKEKGQPTPTPSDKKTHPDTGAQYTYTPGQPYTVNGRSSAQNQSGFSIRPLSTLFEHRKDTVPRSEKTVARSNADAVTTDADTVLKYAKTRLQSNVANFADRQRRKATTAANCTVIINDVAHKIRGRGFEPSPEVADEFFQYIKTVFDAMDANGYPYEYERAFLDDLLQFVPALDTQKAA